MVYNHAVDKYRMFWCTWSSSLRDKRVLLSFQYTYSLYISSKRYYICNGFHFKKRVFKKASFYITYAFAKHDQFNDRIVYMNILSLNAPSIIGEDFI